MAQFSTSEQHFHSANCYSARSHSVWTYMADRWCVTPLSEFWEWLPPCVRTRPTVWNGHDGYNTFSHSVALWLKWLGVETKPSVKVTDRGCSSDVLLVLLVQKYTSCPQPLWQWTQPAQLTRWAKITNSYKLSDNKLREYLQLLLMKPHMLIKYPPNTVIRSACGMTAVCLFNTILLCGAMLFSYPSIVSKANQRMILIVLF